VNQRVFFSSEGGDAPQSKKMWADI
jgi:hypothetical protein